jgi:hypothetical protein
MQKNKTISLTGKQIRCWIDINTYQKLKSEAKNLGIELQMLVGLKLRGFSIRNDSILS